MENYYRRLEALYGRLPQGGLIYVSNYRDFGDSPAQLHFDKRLTVLARERENRQWWTPTVFRKL